MTVIRENIHKKNIANNISNNTGLPLSYAANIVDDIFSILISNIITEKILKIKNFGTFFLRKKNKRIGRNPRSKIGYEISERNIISFKSADYLKKKVNINAKK
jgi:integration host factor subunit alpha